MNQGGERNGLYMRTKLWLQNCAAKTVQSVVWVVGFVAMKRSNPFLAAELGPATRFSGRTCRSKTLIECYNQSGRGVACKFVHTHEGDMETERIRAETCHNLRALQKNRWSQTASAAQTETNAAQTAANVANAANEVNPDQQVYDLMWQKQCKERTITRLQAEIAVINAEIQKPLYR